MSLSLPELWAKISGFAFDEGEVQLSFVKRLARENGWGIPYARRVVEEYRRFAYLCMAAGHACTPSDEVDQAWHLHMLYTESYWDRFCGEALGRELSHGPTKGGNNEGAKFENWYERTLASYRQEFGEEPPGDIWPCSAVRFGAAPHFVRVNAQQNFILPKARVKQAAAGLVVTLLMAGCISAEPTKKEMLIGFFAVLSFFILFIAILIISGQEKKDSRKGDGSSGGSGCSAGTSGCGSDKGADGGSDGGSDGGGSGCGGGGCGGGCGGA